MTELENRFSLLTQVQTQPSEPLMDSVVVVGKHNVTTKDLDATVAVPASAGVGCSQALSSSTQQDTRRRSGGATGPTASTPSRAWSHVVKSKRKGNPIQDQRLELSNRFNILDTGEFPFLSNQEELPSPLGATRDSVAQLVTRQRGEKSIRPNQQQSQPLPMSKKLRRPPSLNKSCSRLLIGSSMVRDVFVPQAETQCHPGAQYHT
ncbi:hypothetical protein WMY93_012769 [Mugilogobius chulae]|uniref:Uncharacterized protein n=1 Tax=Mugilogobius chulae TaxID=88201 RepID=A0AAW0NYG5_9GOBI